MRISDRIHIDLTTEQPDQIKQTTGQAVQGLELTVHELEQRVAPVLSSMVSEVIKNFGGALQTAARG